MCLSVGFLLWVHDHPSELVALPRWVDDVATPATAILISYAVLSLITKARATSLSP